MRHLLLNRARIKSQEVISYTKNLEQRCDMTVKRIKNWSPNFQTPNETSLKKLFLLGPSRSGKTILEQLLIRSPNVYPMLENINLNYSSNAGLLSENLGKLSIHKLFYHQNNSLLNGGYDMITSTSPESIFHIDYLIDGLANTFCVLVKRSRMDIASEIFTSDYTAGHFYSYDHSSIMTYLDTYEAIWGIIAQKGPQRTLEVSFEDILMRPQEVAKKISQLTAVNFQIENMPTYSDYPLSSPFRDHFERKFIN